jgi:hypothetical protein
MPLLLMDIQICDTVTKDGFDWEAIEEQLILGLILAIGRSSDHLLNS